MIKKKLGEKVMTNAFNEFLNMTNRFLYEERFDASGYCEFVDKFWFEKQDKLENSPDKPKFEDENYIVSKVWELCDRYDSCDEIVKHDSYCINSDTLKSELIDIVNKL